MNSRDREMNNNKKKERWIQHYSSSHKILLIGEGDFSFSACLAKAFRNAANMVATCLHTKGGLLVVMGISFVSISLFFMCDKLGTEKLMHILLTSVLFLFSLQVFA